MSEIPSHFDREPVRPQELKWWGVTVGSMAFVARDTDSEGAVDQAYALIGVSRDSDHQTFVAWAPYDEERSKLLTEGFGTVQCVLRVEPFTITAWDSEVSPQRVNAARDTSQSHLSNY